MSKIHIRITKPDCTEPKQGLRCQIVVCRQQREQSML